MAVTSEQVTVSTTAVALNTETGPVAGTRMIVTNKHATDAVALGPTGVTSGTGFRLAAGVTTTVELSVGEQLFAIRTGASDATVDVLRSGA